MFEIIWDTTPFNDKSIWPEDGKQPFVLSQGDKYDLHNPHWEESANLTRLAELVMVSTATTSLDGRAIRCKGPLTATASARLVSR
jgi:hypothetical protein